MVLSNLVNIGAFFKEKKKAVNFEGLVRAAHFYGTTLILLVSFALVSWKEWLSATNSVIDCTSDGNIPTSTINNHCYSESIFTVYDGKEEYLTYYVWVPMMFLYQAAMFYLPHLIYKYFENGTINWIINGLEGWIDCENRESREKEIAVYVIETLGQHKKWCCQIITSYLFYVINVIGQIIFIDWFLGYQFRIYGVKAVLFLFSKVH